MTIEEHCVDSSMFENAGPGCSLFMSPGSETTPILNLVGEIDLSSAPRVYSLIWQSSMKGSRSLILNLEELDFMDSSGLQILLRLREKLRAKKQDIVLVAPKPQIKKILKLTGFDQLFSFYESVKDAQAFFGSPEIAAETLDKKTN